MSQSSFLFSHTYKHTQTNTHKIIFQPNFSFIVCIYFSDLVWKMRGKLMGFFVMRILSSFIYFFYFILFSIFSPCFFPFSYLFFFTAFSCCSYTSFALYFLTLNTTIENMKNNGRHIHEIETYRNFARDLTCVRGLLSTSLRHFWYSKKKIYI